MIIKSFEKYLQKTNLSDNTIKSYLFAIKQFNTKYNSIQKKNLKNYKVWLIENFNPKTVNLRLRAINCYLESIKKTNLKIPFVKVQQKTFQQSSFSTLC